MRNCLTNVAATLLGCFCCHVRHQCPRNGPSCLRTDVEANLRVAIGDDLTNVAATLLASHMSLLQDSPPSRAPDARFLTDGLLFCTREAYALAMREQDVSTHAGRLNSKAKLLHNHLP